MKFVKQLEADDAKLQMTSMIDVVFQLLIFFLVGTKFRVPQGELEAYLPHEGPAKKIEEKIIDLKEIRITLRITHEGRFAPPAVTLDYEGGAGSGTRQSLAFLDRKLATLAENRLVREKVPVVIEAEPQVAYRWVIQTLDICRRHGFKEVNFAKSKRSYIDAGGK